MRPDLWQRVEEVFDLASALPLDERAAYIQEACAGNPELEREVSEMLTADEQAGGFIEDAIRGGSEVFDETSPEPHEGRMFGKYELLDLVGEGGFGQVFKGRDPTLRRLVAIKTCTSKDEHLRQRFYREAQIAAALQHPNIVTVHDFGIADESPFLVQELLGGEDLEAKIARRDTGDLRRQIDILIQIARGLAYAHGQGVLHRDVKPGNIRVLDKGRVKILDFGIARLLSEEQRMTHEGMALGTIGYLAPEQLHGDTIDRRADIFSFGVVAYELLTFKRPFVGESFPRIAYQLLEAEPEPLSMRAPHVPPALAKLVHRCLQKSPKKRFDSFADVLRDLVALKDLESAETTAVLTQPSPWSRALRRRTLVVALLAIASTALGLAWIGMSGGERTQEPTENALPESSALAELEPPTALPSDDVPNTEPKRPPTPPPDNPEPAPGPSAAEVAPAATILQAQPRGPTPPPPQQQDAFEASTRLIANDLPEPEERKSRDQRQRTTAAPPQVARDMLMDGATLASETAAVSTKMPTELEIAEQQTEREGETASPAAPSEEPTASALYTAQPKTLKILTRGEGVVAPEALETPAPVYPLRALRRRIEARITLAVLVDAEGRVTQAFMTHGDDQNQGFEAAAIEAARKTRFRPATHNGQPGMMWTEMIFDFRLP